MSTIKSAGEHLTMSSSGSGNHAFIQADGSTKLETTATGITVTGNLVATSLQGDGAGLTNVPVPASQPVSYITGLQAALDAKTTPADVDVKVAALVASAPATLDTLNELAAALGDDANHATTMTSLVGTKQDTLVAGSNISISGSTISSSYTDTNTTYSAGSGLDISGTTFSVEPDLRDAITHIGYDAGDYIYFSNSDIDFYCNSARRAKLASNGDFHADGDVIAYSTTVPSDERLKENIQPIEDALSKVNQLNGCTFTYTTDGKESAGLIAQDVEKVLPSAVSEKELPLKIDDGKEYKVLQYDQTIGLLVEAIKELTTKVAELEDK